MISPIRSLCFNDDRQTFTIVLPSQYRVFRCEPFGMIFSRDCDDLSLGTVATYNGYRFLALTGSPSPPVFNSKCVKVFDHQTGSVVFDHTFSDHILTMKLGDGVIICCFHCKIEIWNTITNKIIFGCDTGINVHCPLAISPDSSTVVTSGADSKKLNIISGIKAGTNSKSLPADTSAVSVVQFSSNGQLFATSAFSGSNIRVWDNKDKNCIAILERKPQGDIVQTLDFSPDCGFLATCSKDGLVRIFDLRRKPKVVQKEMPPICTAELSSLSMPRVSWISPTTLSVISLEGGFFKLYFNGSSLDVETTSFFKRSE